MAQDFEKLIADVRDWLHHSKGHPSVRNEVGQRGWIRRRTAVLNTYEMMAGVESSAFFRPERVGALMLVTEVDPAVDGGVIRWSDINGISVRSPLIGRQQEFVPITEVAGVTKDAIYERFAPGMAAIINHFAK